MDGWIKMHRKFLEWEWYHDIPCKVLAIHYLLAANFEDKKWEGKTIKRGQLITGLSSLSEKTGLSVQQIRTANRKLIESQFCHIQPTNKHSIITICNYANYQQNEASPPSPNRHQPTHKEHATDTPATHQSHAINNNIRTKEQKNIKTKEQKNTFSPEVLPAGAPTPSMDYAAFMDYFNRTFKGKLPTLKVMTGARQKSIRARLAEHGKESVHTVFRHVLSSGFLLGGNDKGWRCDFDWIFTPRNYIKILEGNYNGPPHPSPRHTHANSSAQQRKEGVGHTAQLAEAILQSYSGEKHT